MSAALAEPAARAVAGRPAQAPLLTAGVLALTAAASLAQAADRDLLSRFERTPAELHGDWWRIATALFFQDGGVVGAVSNLAFLGLIGVAAEQVLSRPRWLLHYFGIGLAVEVLAYCWQPTGAGNSIAVCALAGGVAAASLRDSRLPRYAVPTLLVWCGALLGTLSDDLIVPGIVMAVSAAALAARRPEARRLVPLAVAATGVVLAAAANIHGAALLAGLGLALILPAPGAEVRLRCPGRESP